MAITIVSNLTASPNPTVLPKRVEFQQTLQSTLAAEPIKVFYSLAADHQIWFEDGENQRTKQIEREETVGQSPKVCIDRLPLVYGPGTGPLLTVEIEQAIQDSQGNVIPDLVVLQITA
jgi:hypothetical protein